jgi:hypothetical protein
LLRAKGPCRVTPVTHACMHAAAAAPSCASGRLLAVQTRQHFDFSSGRLRVLLARLVDPVCNHPEVLNMPDCTEHHNRVFLTANLLMSDAAPHTSSRDVSWRLLWQ